jgi:hypothetical protein
MTMSDGGKGSTQRPRSIADEEWANRWNSIFGRDNVDVYKQEQEKKEKEEKDGLDMGSGDLP